MNKQQFDVLADILGLSATNKDAVHRVMFDGEDGDAVATSDVERMHRADAAIRAAYVVHSPMEFRVTVGHRDTHRMPGTLQLSVGDIVRLVGHSTERWIPVRVTALPDSPAGYYHGVIVEQLVKTSKFQAGNGVRFSEDQVMTEAPRASSRRRRTVFL